jgi:DNA polymerase III sliding clamp (beta) subunit (PCNA family)
MEVEMAKGEGQRIAFNSRYLKDFVGAVSAEKLFLETTSQSSPAVFRTQDAVDYVQVIMPMDVRDWG